MFEELFVPKIFHIAIYYVVLLKWQIKNNIYA